MSATTEAAPEAWAVFLDLAERIIVALLLVLLALRFLPSVLNDGNYVNMVLFVSEAVVVVFIVFRRRAKVISTDPADWFFGFAGTVLPLLAVPVGTEPLVSASLLFALMVGGFLFQLWAKLVLRRSFGIVAANRGVKIFGPYRLVRHPMYAGYILTQIGFLLSGPALWNVALYLVVWGMLVMRIRAEERILAKDLAYAQLSIQVRYRLIPLVY
jgi:protein-S-isoprenylcysteine O-methyltransferase Ste14